MSLQTFYVKLSTLWRPIHEVEHPLGPTDNPIKENKRITLFVLALVQKGKQLFAVAFLD